MTKIRVLLVQETVGSGGVEQRRYTLAKLLDKNKYELKIICTQAVGPLADKIRSEGVEVIQIGLLKKVWDWRKYRAVINVINAFKPHIIHGAVFEGVLLATIGGKLGKVPIIIAEETSDPYNRSKKASVLLRLLSMLSKKFIGVSPAAYDYLKYTAAVPIKKLRLINNGVAPPIPIDESHIISLKKKFGLDEGDIIVGSVGRVRNNVKRFTDLVEALALLKAKYPTLKLFIVGDGPDRQLIQQAAELKQIADRVIMAGYQEDPHPFYEMMDIFAIVSRTESFGLVAVEAMFHKRPVIATSVGGLKSIVVDNRTGVLVDVNRPDQIASAIDYILSDKNKCKQMGESGFTRAQDDYSAQRYVSEVETLYQELLVEEGIVKSNNT